MKKNLISLAVLGAFAALPVAVLAEDAAPAPAPAAPSLSTPGMDFPLTANANPLSVDAGPLGKVYVSGALTALGLLQNNAVTGNRGSLADISNAQVFIQKVDGPIQFYLQGGGYSLPSLGTSYLRSGRTTKDFYGVFPQAFIKFAPNDSFSIQAGKLPTLIGAEYTFTFENTNIERGLLWNQENAVNRGVQANYSKGPLAFSLAVNDGFYSKRYNWLTGSVGYTINDNNAVSVVAGGNLGTTKVNTLATPIAQNNGQFYNLIYKYTSGPWTLQPYLQYTHVPSNSNIGIAHNASTYGAALLANYAFNSTFNVGGRVEYIDSDGKASNGAPNLLGYGVGSKAWSLTITPTYQVKTFFARADLSYVKASSTTPGLVFGKSGNDDSQSRLLIETGFLF